MFVFSFFLSICAGEHKSPIYLLLRISTTIFLAAKRKTKKVINWKKVTPSKSRTISWVAIMSKSCSEILLFKLPFSVLVAFFFLISFAEKFFFAAIDIKNVWFFFSERKLSSSYDHSEKCLKNASESSAIYPPPGSVQKVAQKGRQVAELSS